MKKSSVFYIDKSIVIIYNIQQMLRNVCCILFYRGDNVPPKPKYSREELIESAYSLVRESGAEALTARELADQLGTSSRPIFTAFESMSELRNEVVRRCERTYSEYVIAEKATGKYPEYKAMGMAYIRLAKQEKNIFKLLYMRDRSGEKKSDDRSFDDATHIVSNQLMLDKSNAERLHTEIWIWVHGIASILATSYLDLEFDVISDMLTDVYTALKRRYSNE